MSEPLIVGQLRVCADCAKDSPDGFTRLNRAARPMLRQAADEIERLRGGLVAIAAMAPIYDPDPVAVEMARVARNTLRDEQRSVVQAWHDEMFKPAGDEQTEGGK